MRWLFLHFEQVNEDTNVLLTEGAPQEIVEELRSPHRSHFFL